MAFKNANNNGFDRAEHVADKTTEEIVAVVSENLKRTKDAVELIARCQNQAGEALELSTEAGQVMGDIQRGAQKVVDAVSQFNQQL